MLHTIWKRKKKIALFNIVLRTFFFYISHHLRVNLIGQFSFLNSLRYMLGCNKFPLLQYERWCTPVSNIINDSVMFCLKEKWVMLLSCWKQKWIILLSCFNFDSLVVIFDGLVVSAPLKRQRQFTFYKHVLETI